MDFESVCGDLNYRWQVNPVFSFFFRVEMPWLHKTMPEVKNITNDGSQSSEISCIKEKKKEKRADKKLKGKKRENFL